MSIKKITELSLLTAAALIIFIVELRIPDIIPIPGVKLGLANIITVYAVYRFKPGETAMLVTARIILGSFFGGNVSAIIYSASGAVLCLLGMLAICRVIPQNYVWLCSVIGAILHNVGQITAAVCVTGSFAVISYLPILIVSGSIAGLFTGMCARLIIKRALPHKV